MRFAAMLVWAFAATLFFTTAGHAERRVALVIGNSGYQKVAALPNPVHDAVAMGDLFRRVGFDLVEVKTNLDQAALRKALRDFSDVAREADIAVVFYAGHGMEVGGSNYLIPTDAVLERDIDVEDEAVSLDRVNQIVEPAKRLRLIVLDACRDNPFASGMRRTTASRSIGRGLARVDVATADTMVAFAAKPGSTAADGQGANSPFTAALLKHLATPGLDLRLAMGRVRDEVLASTDRKQEPIVFTSLGGAEISLVPARSGLPVDACAAAAEHWKAAEAIGTLAAFEDHLARFPNCPFAGLARAQIEELKKRVVVARPPSDRCGAGPVTASFSSSRPSCPLSAGEERSLQPKDSFKECDKCPEMVAVPAGSFTMGSDEPFHAGSPDGPPIDGPQHRVTMTRSFAVGRFAVTFDEWDACVADGGCNGYKPSDGWGRGRRPVINVNWNDATAYATWLSRKTGMTYRLLSESEWEYAARAGSATRYFWGNDIGNNNANCTGCASQWDTKQAAPVGSFKPNAFGLYDMAGNVWQWVQDCWRDGYNGAPADGSARTSGDCGRRVVRGGSWSDLADDLRSANRDNGLTVKRDFDLGFRVGRTFLPP